MLVANRMNLLDAFSNFDANGDGVISAEEFRDGFARMDFGLEDAEVEQFLELLDADGSGGLDYDEFLQQFRDLGKS